MRVGETEVTVECQVCEKPLSAEFVNMHKGELFLIVEPCKTCLEKAGDDGGEEGMADAKSGDD